MRAVSLAAVFLFAATAFAGKGQICTDPNRSGRKVHYQITKDCCAAVNQNTYFDEVGQRCVGKGGCADNAVNTGEMVKCCASRGAGSWEVGCRVPSDYN